MKICHVCNAECEENAELCQICGADLTEDVACDEKMVEVEEVILKNPVLVASVDDVVSAEIFKDILHENGIIFTGDEPDSDGTLKVVFGGGFVAEDIYVEDTDFDKAKQLYEDFLNSEPGFDGEFFEEDGEFSDLNAESENEEI